LRNETACSISLCNKAIVEGGDDIETAKAWLRKNAGTKMQEKYGQREVHKGLIGLRVLGNEGTMIELNCETDFVAKTDAFVSGAKSFLQTVSNDPSISVELDKSENKDIVSSLLPKYLDFPLDKDIPKQSIAEGIRYIIGKTQENCQIRRIFKSKLAEQGVIGSYLHNQISEDLAHIGCLVFVHSDTQKKEELKVFANNIAAHIAAMKPAFLSKEEIPECSKEGKDEKGLKDLYKQNALYEQEFIFSDESRLIKDYIKEKEKEFNGKVEINKFGLFICGA